MIVQRFLEWAQTVPASRRADGVSALARAYLYTSMDDAQKRAAEVALTAQLDDPAPIVRRALAESFASASEAPRHIVVALANDQSDISSLVLSRSPVLMDGDLIDCACIGDAYAQSAIALRASVSKGVAAALAEIAEREALLLLLNNEGARIADFSLTRIVQRFGADAEIREIMLARPHLPASLRSELVLATSHALANFVTECNWLSSERTKRLMREAREKAQIIIATSDSGHDSAAFAQYLRQSGQLTAGLVLRALLSGNISLFEGALIELSGVSPQRVAGLLRDWRGAGFTALYAKAKLPPALLTAFRAALAALQAFGPAHDPHASARLSRDMIEAVLAATHDLQGRELQKVHALLRRFEAEAAREDARLHTSQMAQLRLEKAQETGIAIAA